MQRYLKTLLAVFASTAICCQYVSAQQEASNSSPAESSDQSAATQTPTAVKQQLDPTGTWKWEREFNGNANEFVLKLNWDGKALTGDYTSFGSTADIEQAKLDGEDISFTVLREFNGNEFEIDFDGKVELDEINGTISMDFGGEPREFEWQAARHVDLEDVLGTWQLSMETPNGDLIEPSITISKEDDALVGKYDSVFGQRDAKNIALKENELTWEISGEGDRGTFKAVYKGTVRGNKIEGTNEFDFNGNTGTWDFSGEREIEKDSQPPTADTPG